MWYLTFDTAQQITTDRSSEFHSEKHENFSTLVAGYI